MAKERDPFKNPKALASVFDYVQARLDRLGHRCERHAFSFSGSTFENLLAHAEGRSPDLAPFLVGAHLDAVPGSPGADDNASGVAVLLEVAELLSQSRSKHPVIFAGFNLEEYNMIGSQALADDFRAQKKQLAGMLSLEMVGYTSAAPGSQHLPLLLKPFYPDRGNFIALVSNMHSKPLMESMRAKFAETGGLAVETLALPFNGALLPAARLSDHSPFWDAGYRALLVTDTSFFRNPNYHSERDTISTLDIPFMAKIARALALFLSQVEL